MFGRQQKRINKAVGMLGSQLDESTLRECADELVSIGVPAIPTLAMACRSRLLYQRKLAPIVLGMIWDGTRDKAAILALVEALDYPDAKYAAGRTLNRIARTDIPGPWSQETILKIIRKIGDEQEDWGTDEVIERIRNAPPPSAWSVDDAEIVGDDNPLGVFGDD